MAQNLELLHDMISPMIIPIQAQRTPPQQILITHDTQGFLESGLRERGIEATITTAHIEQAQGLFDGILIPLAHQHDNWLNSIQRAHTLLSPKGIIVFHTLINETDDDDALPTLHALGDALTQNGFEHIIVEKYTRNWEFSSPTMQINQLKNAGLFSEGSSLETTLFFTVAHAYKQELSSNLPTSRSQTGTHK